MPTTATGDQPLTSLTDREREVLRAVGRGLTDAEVAAALAVSEQTVSAHLQQVLAKLGLRDRAAAIVRAFDSGLVVPGQDPYGPGGGEHTARFRISLLGPLRARRGDRPLDLGPVRQQAVLAALALCHGRAVSQRELLDGVWGLTPPSTNVVPVYVYRLRKILAGEHGRPHSAIGRDRDGYRLTAAADVDVARMDRLLGTAEAAERAGDLTEAVRASSRALDLFRGEPLAGLPGPFAEVERLRLTERRIGTAQQKLDWQLRLGRHVEAIEELSALAAAHPHNEPVAAMLMRALHRSGRPTEAVAVYTRTRRRLAEDLDTAPGEALRREHRSVLRGDGTGVRARTGAAC